MPEVLLKTSLNDYVVSCPHCRLSIYIHKMLRLLKESRHDYGSPGLDIKEEKILKVGSDSSMTLITIKRFMNDGVELGLAANQEL